MSTFEKYRRQYKPLLPEALRGINYKITQGEATEPISDKDEIKKQFPHTTGLPVLKIEPSTEAGAKAGALKVGVIFSGGQAPGGHNVLCGLFDKLQELAPGTKLIGFKNGPKGLMTNDSMELTADFLSTYRNMGGFHAIGSGRDKIASPQNFEDAAKTAAAQDLDGLVIIGGDDSNTNACVLSEDFLKRGLKTKVVGVPKTIDRDLLSPKGLETSFGFDTAAKVYAELIGNLCYDALSAKKYWHFIRLMGRSASHITLECALQTHPNITMIGEEVLEKKMTGKDVYKYIGDIIAERQKAGKNYGLVLIPEGLIEFIPENNELFDYLNNKLLPNWSGELSSTAVAAKLDGKLKATYESIPEPIRSQLILERDPHGNISVSSIETEKLLIAGVREYFKETNQNVKFNTICHFFGYEGRCAAPSAFDTSYCYGLGTVAAVLIGNGINGYMAMLKNLAETPDKWIAGGLPLTSMMNIEMRHGHPTPVIQKQLVDLKGGPFKYLEKNRKAWASEDHYQQPGAIQLVETQDPAGREVVYQSSMSLLLEHGKM